MARASFCIPRHVPADGHAMTHLVVADLILLPLPFAIAWYNFTTTRPMSQPNDNRTWLSEFRACELMDRNATSIGLSPEIKRDARTERTFSKVFCDRSRNIRKYLDGKRYPFIPPDVTLRLCANVNASKTSLFPSQVRLKFEMSTRRSYSSLRITATLNKYYTFESKCLRSRCLYSNFEKRFPENILIFQTFSFNFSRKIVVFFKANLK